MGRKRGDDCIDWSLSHRCSRSDVSAEIATVVGAAAASASASTSACRPSKAKQCKHFLSFYASPFARVCVCVCVHACLCEHVVTTERKNNVNVTVNTLCKSVALSADPHQRLLRRRQRQRRQLHRRQMLFFVNELGAFLPFIVSRAREKQSAKGNYKK